MKTALLFSTKYGSTEKVAKQIAGKLNINVEIVNLADQNIDIKQYDAFILGMPVLAENTTIHMRRFLKQNLDFITDKLIAVFLLCWNSQKWEVYLEKLFNNKLPKDCISACMGGEFNFDKMHDIEKNIIRDMTGVEKTTSKISQTQIDEFANKINRRLG